MGKCQKRSKNKPEMEEQPSAVSNPLIAVDIIEEMASKEDIEDPRDSPNFKAKKKRKVERVLPGWQILPVIDETVSHEWESIALLDPKLIQKLKDNGLEKSFPVQSSVVPALLDQCRSSLYSGDGGCRQRDIFMCAPTGSGKTLAYVLPIIQALQGRPDTHIRALVILPVRDLAIQVYQVFQQYMQGTDIKIALLSGKRAFRLEQKELVKERLYVPESEKWGSMADIVVADRERLLDHIMKTEGFDLTHLRWLVIDEADRQAEDVHNGWLKQVEAAAYTPKPGYCGSYPRDPPPVHLTAFSAMERVMHPQKILVSATLTQDPETLELMNLFLPLLYTVVATGSKSSSVARGEKSEQDAEADVTIQESHTVYSTPASLTEKYMDCKKADKPLILLDFVVNQKMQQVMCFTNSVNSAHRLYLLVKQIQGLKVGELSSRVPSEKRGRIRRKFDRGDLQLLICSDMMARGIHMDNVQYVISYNVPRDIEKYIHRVGRTARAYKKGTAITLVEGQEMHHFKKMMRGSGKWDKLKEIHAKRHDLESLVPQYNIALKKLPAILKEQRKQLKN